MDRHTRLMRITLDDMASRSPSETAAGIATLTIQAATLRGAARAALYLGHMLRDHSAASAAPLSPNDQALADHWIALAHAALSDAEAPTHRHVKRGGTYTLEGQGKLQTDTPLGDMTELVAYRGEDGALWFRAPAEFFDGRFSPVSE